MKYKEVINKELANLETHLSFIDKHKKVLLSNFLTYIGFNLDQLNFENLYEEAESISIVFPTSFLKENPYKINQLFKKNVQILTSDMQNPHNIIIYVTIVDKDRNLEHKEYKLTFKH